MERRATRRDERTTPCECCGYPISQRHHLYKVANYGENKFTIQLCANCHELFHLVYNSMTINHVSDEDFKSGKKNLPITRAQSLWGHVIQRLGFEDKRITFIGDLAREVIKAEGEIK
jgi:hypothetical protein